ncbi:MAG: hypothetical protein KA165_13955 [Saprospiraceae bacterium]|nr:hypothetical protein [Saprospiraceae bacterium]
MPPKLASMPKVEPDIMTKKHNTSIPPPAKRPNESHAKPPPKPMVQAIKAIQTQKTAINKNMTHA